MRILLVEDEPLIQKSLKLLLERHQASVDVEQSGKNAIQLILSNEYDRIICDLMLQDITGFDVIEDSKAKFSPEEIKHKFIIITAYSSPQVLEKAAEYGCKLISKPFEDTTKAIEIFLGKDSNELPKN
jgi:CheY-like chemotaxis protein